MRRAKGLGRNVRGALATRGASSDADGSGAPAYRGRLVLLSLAALALTGLLLAISSAFASKQVIDRLGSGGGFAGGEFSNPGDAAGNTTGAGGVPAGTVYVADEGRNRIQRFDPDGSFVSAWGANVLSAAADEVQMLQVNATAGTYTLSFGGATTAPIAYNASRSTINAALASLPTLGGSNVLVEKESSPFKISFTGSLSATNVPPIFVEDSALPGTVAITTATQGSGAYEICTVAENCRAGVATGGANAANTAKNGSLDSPQSVAVDDDTGNVYVSDRDNYRVNEYTASGTFIRSFGWGVDATAAGSEYEVCPAANRCAKGSAGAGAGQIGSTFSSGTLGLAVSPPEGEAAVGQLFLADSQNRRVNTYALDGTSPSSFGSSGNFGTTQPRKIAVDSRGIVYASDSNSSAEIDRYDTKDANGGGVGFLTSIATPPLLAGSGETATSGLAVDPDSDGAGADEDVLYVLRDPSSGSTVVQQFGPSNDPGLTAPPAAADDSHGAEAGLGSVSGLGLDYSSGRLYVSGGFSGAVYVIDDVVAPAATLNPITSFDAHSATFTGAVNPNGNRTKYRFEYVDHAGFLANGFTNASLIPIADVDLGAGTASIPLEAETPHHLVPNTTYHVRLLAKQFFTATQTIGGPLTFTTPGAAPSFHVGATADTEAATLRAAIDPENQAVTNYHFEWGASAAYGSSTPAGSLPSGTQPVAIEEEIMGLTAGQTYHYRLVATNGTGTTNGPDRTFTAATPPPALPERGYEIASLYPTEGIPVSQLETTGPNVAEDGDTINFNVLPPYPRSDTGLPFEHIYNSADKARYRSVRGPNGWQVEDIGWGTTLDGGAWSPDGRRYVFGIRENGSENARLDPDDENGRVDLYQHLPDGSDVWITRDPRIPAGTPQTASVGEVELPGVRAEVMSADGKTVVFSSKRQLSDEDTTPTPEFGAVPFRLYKWTDGQLSFIGKRPDGSVPTTGSHFGTVGSTQFSSRHALSRDGSRVIFSASRSDSNGGGGIYVQTDGEPTVEATKETGVAPLPANQPFAPTLRGASEDASRVFFTTSSRLTPDSGGSATSGGDEDLYLYDIEADEVRDLTPRLDGIEDPTVDPPAGDRADVLGVAAESQDGKRVYFVANASYDVAPNPRGELPSVAGRNLYVAELDGIEDPIELRFIATLGAADSEAWIPGLNGVASLVLGKSAYASPDGSVLGFGSSQNLTGQALGGTEQLFVYDAAVDTLACASCPPDGSLPASHVNVRFTDLGQSDRSWQNGGGERRWVSSEGSVFFHTSSPLVDEDENTAEDVYEYRDGELALISAGTGTRDSKLSNASVDGSTVFINTLDTLAPQDEEPGVPKFYAARVGGGFPLLPRGEGCDLGAGACEGPGTSAPPVAGAGSAAFEGPGDPKPNKARGCPKGKRKVRRKGNVRCIPRKHHRTAKHNRRAGR
jgi:hypothetical protein